MEDVQIIDLYFCRDENAICETDQKYGEYCFSIANNILHSKEDSEECVNDTYISVWNKIPPTRPNCFKAFISKITRNLSLKRLDYNMAQKRNPGLIVSLSELEEMLPDDKIYPDISDEQIKKLIVSFLKSEKPITRKVFIRKYFFFDSISDIARHYSYSESKVKSMLFHTRNKLKDYLEKEGVEL